MALNQCRDRRSATDKELPIRTGQRTDKVTLGLPDRRHGGPELVRVPPAPDERRMSQREDWRTDIVSLTACLDSHARAVGLEMDPGPRGSSREGDVMRMAMRPASLAPFLRDSSAAQAIDGPVPF